MFTRWMVVLCVLPAGITLWSQVIVESQKSRSSESRSQAPSSGKADDPGQLAPQTGKGRPEMLMEIIRKAQRDNVRESCGVYAHECFTDADLAEFKANGTAKRIAINLKRSKEMGEVVRAIKALPKDERDAFLASCRRPLRDTWAQRGKIDCAGQTDSGQRAELLIADAIIELAAELIELPVPELTRSSK